MARSYTPTAMYRYGAMQKAGGAGSPAGGLGPELVNDPGFDNGADWSDPTKIIGSQLNTTGIATPLVQAVAETITAGKKYFCTLEISVDAGTVCVVAFGGQTVWQIGDGLTTIAAEFTASTNDVLNFSCFSSTSVFDSISIREVL